MPLEPELPNHPHHRILRDIAAKRIRDERENVDLPTERPAAVADQVRFVKGIWPLVAMEDAQHSTLEVGRRVEESADRRGASTKHNSVLSRPLVVRPDRQGPRESLLLDREQHMAEGRRTQGAFGQWLWDRRRQSFVLQGTIRVTYRTRQ